MKKVVITGPECTGKTTLTKALAKHYRTKWVPEFAREYLNELDREYKEEDLLEIAKGQLNLEDKIESECSGLLFYDTNLTVIKIWQEYKYGRCFEEVVYSLKSRKYHLHLLMTPDIPWTFDDQRENPYSRAELFDMYKSELDQNRLNYESISGNFNARFQRAVEVIENII